MTAAFHVFPNFSYSALEDTTSSTPIKLQSDTLKVLLISSTGNSLTWNSTLESCTNISGGSAGTSVMAGSGAGALTEVSYSGATPASRFTLTGVTLTTSGLVSTLTATSPAWTNATWSTTYAVFYDYTAGGSSDTAGIPICYWDFGGAQSVSAATFTLTISGSGLVTWTNS